MTTRAMPWRRRRERIAAPAEEVSTIRILILGPHTLWWAIVPRLEAEAALGEKWLLWPKPVYWRLWYALFAAAAVAGLCGALLVNINAVRMVVALLLLPPLGWQLGWRAGDTAERTKNAPIYAVRSESVEGKRTVAAFGYEPLDAVDIKTSTLRQITGLPEGQSPDGKPPPRQDSTIAIAPAAWSSKFLMDRWQMVDDRAAFQGSMSPWEKLKYGSLGVIAISLVVMVFLTVAATQNYEDAPTTTAQEAPAQENQGDQ